MRNERGLSFIEMLIAMALMAVVVVAFYGLVTVTVRGWGSLQGQMDVQQHPRVAASRVAAEIRQSRDFMISGGGMTLGLVKATILMADTSTGATSVTVEDASMLTVGRPIVIISLNRLEQVTVTSITPSGANFTVNFNPVLSRPHKQGELVRRGLTTVSVAASVGATTLSVASGITFQANDMIAVGDEAPFTVTAVAINIVTITPALAQGHAVGEAVQPLSVVFSLAGIQLTRCVSNCASASNQIPVADFMAAPPGRQFFAVVKTTTAGIVNSGDTQVCVVSVSGFAVNDLIQVDREAHGTSAVTLPDRRTVTAINSATNCLTVDRGLMSSHPAGSIVRVNAVDLNIQATQFNDVIQQTQEVSVTSKAAPRN